MEKTGFARAATKETAFDLPSLNPGSEQTQLGAIMERNLAIFYVRGSVFRN